MSDTVAAQLIAFISSELLEGGDELVADQDLLADGMVDSLGMVRLVAHIEDQFGIRVPPTDFTIANFRSVQALAGYLNRRRDEAAGGHDG